MAKRIIYSIIALALISVFIYVFLKDVNNQAREEEGSTVRSGAVNQAPAEPADEPADVPAVSASKKELDLSGQDLRQLPQSLFAMSDLEELEISDNNLTGALPGEIRFLNNLKKLDASNNQMTGIPAEVGQLSELEELNYANNRITGLPQEIANLKNLKILNLSGNVFSAQDLAGIKQSLPDLQVIGE